MREHLVQIFLFLCLVCLFIWFVLVYSVISSSYNRKSEQKNLQFPFKFGKFW